VKAFRWFSFVVVAGVMLAGIAVIWLPGYQFTNDGPQHLLGAIVHATYESSPLELDQTWFLNEPLTDHGFRELVQAFTLLGFGPWAANNWAIVALFLMWCGGWWALGRQVDSPPLSNAVAGVLFFSKFYWFGLWPFMSAAAVVPWLLTWFLHTRLGRVVDIVVFGGGMLLVVHAHPLPAVILGGICLASLRNSTEFFFLVGASLPAALLTLAIRGFSPPAVGAFEWAYEASWLAIIFGEYLPGFGVSQLLLVVLLGAALIIPAPLVNVRLSVVALSLILGGIALPDNIPGWEIVGPRLLTFGVPLLLVCARTRWGAVVQLLAAVFVVVHVVGAVGFANETEKRYRPTYEALRVVNRFGPIDWELHILDGEWDGPERQIEKYSGFAHMGQVLALEKGGRPAFTQATNRGLHHILAPPYPDRHLGHSTGTILGEWARFWTGDEPSEARAVRLAEYFSRVRPSERHVVIAQSTDLPLLERVGLRYQKVGDVPGAEIVVGSLAGCDVAVLVGAQGSGDVAEIGIAPSEAPIDILPLRAGRNEFSLEGYPCGRWWVRVIDGCSTRADGRSIVDNFSGDPGVLACDGWATSDRAREIAPLQSP
jgi:hypothetical protein